MSRFIFFACLMAFVVPAQVSADTAIGKFKIGGGAGVTPNFGPAAHVGFAVPRFNYEDFFAFVEGTFEQYSTSTKTPAGFDFETGELAYDETKFTTRFIGVNALGVYSLGQWYLFGGVGLVRWSGGVDLGFGESISVSTSGIKLNITAGAGMSFTELLFAEVRWGHQGADLVVTAGVNIH